ncbi:DUF6455 family protein [Ruegeria arenilitoris]|uniref:DUF6455 family protein n=1 Tax=Ruegeria arenilitoris TaxID=1173585 RepID=UPI00147DEF76|nr:DUF6455 family protein [Ruegeria arenilitoris]
MVPSPLDEAEKHFWLTRSVARCMGVSFTDAIAEGRLKADGFAELVARCQHSGCSEKCYFWLAKQQARAQAAPEFCVNAKDLNALN